MGGGVEGRRPNGGSRHHPSHLLLRCTYVLPRRRPREAPLKWRFALPAFDDRDPLNSLALERIAIAEGWFARILERARRCRVCLVRAPPSPSPSPRSRSRTRPHLLCHRFSSSTPSRPPQRPLREASCPLQLLVCAPSVIDRYARMVAFFCHVGGCSKPRGALASSDRALG